MSHKNTNSSTRQKNNLKIQFYNSLHPFQFHSSSSYTVIYTTTSTLPPPTPLHKSHPTTNTYRIASSPSPKPANFLLFCCSSRDLQRNFISLIHHHYFSSFTASTPRFPFSPPSFSVRRRFFFHPQSWLPTAIFQTKSPSPDRLC